MHPVLDLKMSLNLIYSEALSFVIQKIIFFDCELYNPSDTIQLPNLVGKYIPTYISHDIALILFSLFRCLQ